MPPASTGGFRISGRGSVGASVPGSVSTTKSGYPVKAPGSCTKLMPLPKIRSEASGGGGSGFPLPCTPLPGSSALRASGKLAEHIQPFVRHPVCKRRSEDPSLKRPGRAVGPE